MAAGRVKCNLILLLIATCVCLAQANQGGILDSNHMISTRKVINEKLLLDGEHVATAVVSKDWLGGRKMAVEMREMKKLKDVRLSGAAGETWKFSSTNSKCDNNLDCDLSISYSSDHGVVESGIVAFHADYADPMPHPPKNN